MLKNFVGGDRCAVQTSSINSPVLNVSPLAMLVHQLIIIHRNPTTKLHKATPCE